MFHVCKYYLYFDGLFWWWWISLKLTVWYFDGLWMDHLSQSHMFSTLREIVIILHFKWLTLSVCVAIFIHSFVLSFCIGGFFDSRFSIWFFCKRMVRSRSSTSPYQCYCCSIYSSVGSNVFGVQRYENVIQRYFRTSVNLWTVLRN